MKVNNQKILVGNIILPSVYEHKKIAEFFSKIDLKIKKEED
jgi:hypothetical protein